MAVAAVTISSAAFADESFDQKEAIDKAVKEAVAQEKKKAEGKYFPFVGGARYEAHVNRRESEGLRESYVLKEKSMMVGTSYRAHSGYTWDLTFYISDVIQKGRVVRDEEEVEVNESTILPNLIPEVMFGYTGYANDAHVNAPYLSGSLGFQGLVPSAVVRAGYQLEDSFVDVGVHAFPGLGYTPQLRAGFKF